MIETSRTIECNGGRATLTTGTFDLTPPLILDLTPVDRAPSYTNHHARGIRFR